MVYVYDIVAVGQASDISIDVSAVDTALGVLVGPLVGAITGPNTPGWLKSILAILLSLVLAVAHVFFSGHLSGEQLALSIALVIIFAGGSYKTITGEASRALQSAIPIKLGNNL